MNSQSEPKVDIETPPQANNPMASEDASSVASVIDQKREKDLIRKIDMHILPFVVLLYLFSFLDRGLSPACELCHRKSLLLTASQSTLETHDFMAWRRILVWSETSIRSQYRFSS